MKTLIITLALLTGMVGCKKEVKPDRNIKIFALNFDCMVRLEKTGSSSTFGIASGGVHEQTMNGDRYYNFTIDSKDNKDAYNDGFRLQVFIDGKKEYDRTGGHHELHY